MMAIPHPPSQEATVSGPWRNAGASAGYAVPQVPRAPARGAPQVAPQDPKSYRPRTVPIEDEHPQHHALALSLTHKA